MKVRILEDDDAGAEGGLVFEVENVSDTVTSLVPTITSKFWFPRHGRFLHGYDVRELDRKLPPVQGQAADRVRLAVWGSVRLVPRLRVSSATGATGKGPLAQR